MPNWDSLIVLALVGCGALAILSQRVLQAFELAASVRSPDRLERVAHGFAKAVWILTSVLAGGGAVLGILWLFFLIAVFAARSMCGMESRLVLYLALLASAVLSTAGFKWAMPRLPVGAAPSGGTSSLWVSIPVWLAASLGVAFILSSSFGMVMFAVSSWGACS
jgi:hypothetical protein